MKLKDILKGPSIFGIIMTLGKKPKTVIEEKNTVLSSDALEDFLTYYETKIERNKLLEGQKIKLTGIFEMSAGEIKVAETVVHVIKELGVQELNKDILKRIIFYGPETKDVEVDKKLKHVIDNMKISGDEAKALKVLDVADRTLLYKGMSVMMDTFASESPEMRRNIIERY